MRQEWQCSGSSMRSNAMCIDRAEQVRKHNVVMVVLSVRPSVAARSSLEDWLRYILLSPTLQPQTNAASTHLTLIGRFP